MALRFFASTIHKACKEMLSTWKRPLAFHVPRPGIHMIHILSKNTSPHSGACEHCWSCSYATPAGLAALSCAGRQHRPSTNVHLSLNHLTPIILPYVNHLTSGTLSRAARASKALKGPPSLATPHWRWPCRTPWGCSGTDHLPLPRSPSPYPLTRTCFLCRA